MPDLTEAVEIAAKALYDHQSQFKALEMNGWENADSGGRYAYRQHVLPIVTALAEAGLLKDS